MVAQAAGFARIGSCTRLRVGKEIDKVLARRSVATGAGNHAPAWRLHRLHVDKKWFGELVAPHLASIA